MILGGKLPGKVGRCRFFLAQNIFTIQRKDSSHAVFFHFGNVSTFRKYGFLRSSMRRWSPSPLISEPQGERSLPTRYATKKFGYPQNGESLAHLFFCVSKIFSYFGTIYNPEILVYNVSEIKNMQKRRKQREGRGQMMDIKLPTVKTHVSLILTKLGGKSRRSEAKTAAKKLRLVPEHL